MTPYVGTVYLDPFKVNPDSKFKDLLKEADVYSRSNLYPGIDDSKVLYKYIRKVVNDFEFRADCYSYIKVWEKRQVSEVTFYPEDVALNFFLTYYKIH